MTPNPAGIAQLLEQLLLLPQMLEEMQSLRQELQELRMAMREQDLITEKEAEQVLKVKETTLRKWRNEGWLPYFGEGKLIKFERKSILLAYKMKFGKVTHFETLRALEFTQKRRAS